MSLIEIFSGGVPVGQNVKVSSDFSFSHSFNFIFLNFSLGNGPPTTMDPHFCRHRGHLILNFYCFPPPLTLHHYFLHARLEAVLRAPFTRIMDLRKEVSRFGNVWNLTVNKHFQNLFEPLHAEQKPSYEDKVGVEKGVKYGIHDRNRLDVSSTYQLFL